MRKLRNGLLTRLALPLALSLTFLSGCATPSGNCSAIPVTEYGDGFKISLALELAPLPEGSATVRFIGDSIALRDAVKACKGEKP